MALTLVLSIKAPFLNFPLLKEESLINSLSNKLTLDGGEFNRINGHILLVKIDSDE